MKSEGDGAVGLSSDTHGFSDALSIKTSDPILLSGRSKPENN
jgi:hypothetical protein